MAVFSIGRAMGGLFVLVVATADRVVRRVAVRVVVVFCKGFRTSTKTGLDCPGGGAVSFSFPLSVAVDFPLGSLFVTSLVTSSNAALLVLTAAVGALLSGAADLTFVATPGGRAEAVALAVATVLERVAGRVMRAVAFSMFLAVALVRTPRRT